MSINSIGNNVYRSNISYRVAESAALAELANAKKAEPATKSYPVEYKGTAFGDPAIIARPDMNKVNYMVAASSTLTTSLGVENKAISKVQVQSTGNLIDTRA